MSKFLCFHQAESCCLWHWPATRSRVPPEPHLRRRSQLKPRADPGHAGRAAAAQWAGALLLQAPAHQHCSTAGDNCDNWISSLPLNLKQSQLKWSCNVECWIRIHNLNSDTVCTRFQKYGIISNFLNFITKFCICWLKVNDYIFQSLLSLHQLNLAHNHLTSLHQVIKSLKRFFPIEEIDFVVSWARDILICKYVSDAVFLVLR